VLSPEYQYQLWAMIDNQPIDLGIFEGGLVEGLIKMKDIGMGATVFTVTVEPRGGSETPSMETMQVAGNVELS